MTTSPSPRKRPWELHAIVCLFLITIGVAMAQEKLRPTRPEPEHLLLLAGLTFSLIGLFRGSQIAWWASSMVFAVLSVMMIYATVEQILKYGFVAHQSFFEAYLMTTTCLATFGLLLSVRLRKAFPSPAEPLAADLPAFRAVAKILAPLVFLIAAGFSLMTPMLFVEERYRGERNVSTSLKTIASANADFRANDRDWNHQNEFWTGDVAGLYGIVPPKDAPVVDVAAFRYSPPTMSDGKTTRIKLIEYSIALADGHPLKDLYPPLEGEPYAKAGAWFAALRVDRSVEPAETYGLRNTSRFGFIAYSNDYIVGLQYAFIVNENNTIFRHRLDRSLLGSGNRPPGPPSDPAFRDWPSDDDLKARWGKLD